MQARKPFDFPACGGGSCAGMFADTFCRILLPCTLKLQPTDGTSVGSFRYGYAQGACRTHPPATTRSEATMFVQHWIWRTAVVAVILVLAVVAGAYT